MLESKLQKVLKPRHLWALAVGAVCSGNYYGFSYGFETGGPGSFLLAFLPVTAMYVCFMACFMELAVSSPSAGGASEYARRSMGGFAGFIAGFSVLVAYIVAPCAVAITTGQLLHYLVPAIPAMTATVVFFCLFVALNLLGAKSSSRFELIATIAALAGLVLFAVVALPHFQPERLMLDEPPAAGLSGVAAAVPFAMWFYFAVDGPIMQSEEMEDPKTGILRGYVPALVTLFITALIDLLEMLCREAPDVRIRFGSLEPRTITEAFCARAAKLGNLCPHFHLSMQSGCDATLKRMNRKYDTARFYEACTLLRRYFDDPAITTDLIAGFPEETEEEFAETLAFIEKCAFADMHVFPYSIRPGTKAAEMRQVDMPVRVSRAARASEIAGTMHRAYMERCVGKTFPVLFEQDKDGHSVGHAPNYMEVRVEEAGLHNQVRMAKITRVDGETLCAELSEE